MAPRTVLRDPKDVFKDGQMNLSFAGCGFMGIYHVGVLAALKYHVPEMLTTNRVAGASAGSLAACGLVCDCDLSEVMNMVMEIAKHVRSMELGPLDPRLDLMGEVKRLLNKFLPDDAYVRATGRLFISLTRLGSNFANKIVSEFQSNDELVEALLASCWIPGMCGLIPPKLEGVQYIDGGFSNNNPLFDESTVTVAPFAGESDICPKDSCETFAMDLFGTSFQMSSFNVARGFAIVYPPNLDELNRILRMGFEDTIRFLGMCGLICADSHCFVTHSIKADDDYGSEEESESEEEEEEEEEPHCQDPSHCLECTHKVMANELRRNMLPSHITEALEEQKKKEEEQKGTYMNRLREWKLYKLLSLCVQPTIISTILGLRALRWAPRGMYRATKSLLNSVEDTAHTYSARMTTQIDITETNYDAIPETPKPLLRSKSSDSDSDEYDSDGHKKDRHVSHRSSTFSSEFKPVPKRTPEDCVAEVRHQLLDEQLQEVCVEGADAKSEKSQESDVIPHEFDPDSFAACQQMENKMEKILRFHYVGESGRLQVAELFEGVGMAEGENRPKTLHSILSVKKDNKGGAGTAGTSPRGTPKQKRKSRAGKKATVSFVEEGTSK